jgi:hypothetical protein
LGPVWIQFLPLTLSLRIVIVMVRSAVYCFQTSILVRLVSPFEVIVFVLQRQSSARADPYATRAWPWCRKQDPESEHGNERIA